VASVSARLIVALDYATAAEGLAMVDALGDACDFYKVGSELFTAEGPALVRSLGDRGAGVFLDLKFHDIPNTMRGSARSAAALGVRLLTVHGSAGEAGIAAAVEGAGGRCDVLAVTVLTSLDAGALASVWGRDQVAVEEEVLRLAAITAEAGARGVVCSGREATAVKRQFGNRLAVLVPGVRPAGTAAHDQARVVTPRQAAEAGADYVVVGRAVTQASHPGPAAEAIRRELA
jgi:orotidine-5'-phosphate decarboxylase